MPFVERDGVQIHYRDEGAGCPVVLHTGGAGDGTMWDGAGYTARLAGFRLLIVDHRGRGRSGRVSTLAGHRPVEYVADVIAVADAVGAVELAFAGYSMGASVGYGLAAAHPGRISALVAIGGVADESGADDGTTELIDLLERGGAPALTRAIEEGEGITLPGWLRRNFDETDAAQFVLSLRAWAEQGDTTWNDLAGIRCPTALVAGFDESPPGTLERMRAAITGGAAIAWIEGRGHVGAFLDSAAVLHTALPVLGGGRAGGAR